LMVLTTGESHGETYRPDAQTTGSEPKVLRRDAFYGVHFDLHPTKADQELGADLDPENIEKLLTRARLDYVHYDCKGHPGIVGYPNPKVGWAAPGIVNDSLAAWREATRRHGVSLLVHYSGLLDEATVEHHPDWAARDAAGNRDKSLVSIFSPYVAELMLPQLKEAVSRYDLDGVWSDGDCWAAKWDYSTTSVATFQRETGITSAPLKRGEPHWDEWKAFNRRQVENYIRAWIDPLHEFKPGIQLTSNWMYASFAPKAIETNVDFLSGDLSGTGSVDNARFESRVLASTGKPWDLMSWGFSNGPGGSHLLKPVQQLQQEAASILALGGGYEVYYQPTRRGYLVDAVIEAIGQVGDFCRAREEWSHHTTPVPQVALLLSSESLWDRMDSVYSSHGQYNALQGALHALLESHYSVDVLAEHQLEPVISQYPLVAIAQAHKLKPDFKERVLQYVRGGGKLLLLDWDSAKVFSVELGTKAAGDPEVLTAELTTTAGLVPVHGPWQRVEKGSAEVLASRYPTRDTRTSESIAATVVSMGKGQIAAVYGPISQSYYDTHHPALREWIGALAKRLFPQPMLEVDAPPSVDVALRKTHDGSTVVHLMNFAETPRGARNIAVDEVPTVGPVTVKLRQDAKPQSVSLQPGTEQVEWDWSGGVATVKVPTLHIHSVVVVK